MRSGFAWYTDYALIQCLVLEAAIFVGVANLLADVVQEPLDPRVCR